MKRFYTTLNIPWYTTIGLAVFALVLVRTAWVCDDAFITFRVADNWLNGYGLRWNVAERVQAYTNPLWLFVVALFYGISGEIFYTSILLSIALSLAAVGLLAIHCASGPRAGLLVLALLLGSKAFIDFSTSGLENPLSHLLLAIFLWLYCNRATEPKTFIALTLTTGLALCNRMDSILLLGPALLWAANGVGWRNALPRLALGLSPFVLWLLFAVAYYGFPFPNTAYAKLNTGIPAFELAAQGGRYLLNSLVIDPVTLPAIVAALGWALWCRKRDAALGLGLALHLLYVVKIGGDFMSGRFLAAPLLVAAGLLGRAQPWVASRRVFPAALVAIALGGLAGHLPSLFTRADFSATQGESLYLRVTDQRLDYYATCGLLPALLADTPFPNDQMAIGGRNIRRGRYSAVKHQGFYLTRVTGTNRLVGTWVAVGFIGFYAGPQLHIVDAYALGEALLARLPSRQQKAWIAGHFLRLIPDGYWETQHSGENQIANPQLRQLYTRLSTVVRGPLWRAERWSEIWRFNTGAYTDLVDVAAYRHPSPLDAALADARIKRDPSRYIKIAREYFKVGQIDKGARALDTALKLYPDSALNHSIAGNLLSQNGLKDQAGPIFAKAVELSPAYLKRLHQSTVPADRFVPYIDLSMAFEATQNFSNALDLVRRAAALRPNSAVAHARLGRLHSSTGNLDSAAVHLGRTATLKPDNPWHHINYGYVLRALGRLDEAVAAYQQGIAHQPERGDFHQYLGLVEVERGNTTAAIAALQRAVDLGPEDGGAFAPLAKLYQSQNRAQDALVVYQRLLAHPPPGAGAADFAAAGLALYQMGALNLATTAYQQALEHDQSLTEVRINLGWCLYRQQNLDQAIAAYRQALTKGPNNVAQFNLGLALLHQGNVKDAEAAYASAIEEFGADTGRRIGADDDLRQLATKTQAKAARRILRKYWPD